MLTAAQAGDWDAAMVHGQQYCEQVERLRMTERTVPLDDAARAMKYDLLVRILENDALTRDLALPQLARLGELLGRPAALGNVLVQRLDAVLGTTMSAATANQVSGARPDAVSQPGGLDKPGSSDGSTRDSRQGIQTGGARGDRQNTVVDAKTAAALALAAR
ncbi:hypothetical protein G6F22_018866 [Rhizopus arrhizus]|nr:hypothetical protein G6F22_018866 [Rhizopus arrhizus]